MWAIDKIKIFQKVYFSLNSKFTITTTTQLTKKNKNVMLIDSLNLESYNLFRRPTKYLCRCPSTKFSPGSVA